MSTSKLDLITAYYGGLPVFEPLISVDDPQPSTVLVAGVEVPIETLLVGPGSPLLGPAPVAPVLSSPVISSPLDAEPEGRPVNDPVFTFQPWLQPAPVPLAPVVTAPAPAPFPTLQITAQPAPVANDAVPVLPTLGALAETVGGLIPPLQPVTDFLAARPLVTAGALLAGWWFRRQLGMVALVAAGWWFLSRRVTT